jgi:hypothetical protein
MMTTSTPTQPASPVIFAMPVGVAADAAGNVYVTDTVSVNVRKIAPAGTVSTLSNSFVQPIGIATDIAGNVYVEWCYPQDFTRRCREHTNRRVI